LNPSAEDEHTRFSGATNHHEGGPSKIVLLVDINVRVGQENGDNRIMAVITGIVKGSRATINVIPLVYIEIANAPEDLFHLVHLSLLSCCTQSVIYGLK